MWPRPFRVTQRLLFPVSRRWCTLALSIRALSTTATAGVSEGTNGRVPLALQRDEERAELLEVEILSPEGFDLVGDEGEEGEENINGMLETGEQETGKDGAAEIITVVDAFARAKVANFIRRVESTTGTGERESGAESKQLTVEVREVQTSESDGDILFHARLLLPLPAACGERWAEGLAPTAKEAELVVAMHAERIIDAMGIPMFQLTSKQRRHAEAARSAGRWAPLPGDDPLPPNTPSPPRLQLVRESTVKAAERRLQIDKLQFSTVTVGAFTPMKLTLASPLFLDYGSVHRIKQFFSSYNCLFRHHCRITALHKDTSKARCGGSGVPLPSSDAATASGRDDDEVFVAQIKLPIDGRFGERIACGKAPTKKEAYTLACMHAELIIDTLGLALYPSCRAKQEAHAAECRKVNRWCSGPDDCEYHYKRASPPPLQLSKEAKDVASAEVSASVESVLLSHSKAIEAFTHITELDTLVLSARRRFMDYMSQCGTCNRNMASPFFVEALGIKNHHTYRATVTVPVLPVKGEEQRGDPKVSTNDAVEVLSSFVALGIGTSELEAETAASMHALRILEMLNRTSDSGWGSECSGAGTPLNLTNHVKLPPPYRYVLNHIGRVMVPGLCVARSLTPGVRGVRRETSSTDTEESRLLRARAEVPKTDWSLEPDADGYIIVHPATNVEGGRNYVHTLPSVRQSDRFATVRLRDYLERHGKRLESALKITVSSDSDEGLKRWVCRVVLPVPEAFESVVAHGEAYKEEEAVVMCAVHAELVLDEIGVAMYDLPTLQKKHSGAASLLGRWAPLETSMMRKGGHVPPPVRKEHENSSLWARLTKGAATGGQKDVWSGGALPVSPAPDTHNVRLSSSGVEGKSAAVLPSSMEVQDDLLCDLSKLVSVHPSDIFQHAPRVFDLYCRRMGVDISRITRQYNVLGAHHGPVHRAILEIPLPIEFGRRHAVGCASTKKEAYTLCCMHAVFTLGALGVQVYSGPKQAEFARNARLKGKKAPMPGDPLLPPNTKSPPGLKSFPDMHREKPVAPAAPDLSECRKPLVWGNYITACRAYIKRRKDHEVFDALFEQRKTPRSGVELEDNGLDAVEALPLFANARSQLPQRCAASGLPSPPPHSFRYEVHGKVPHRRYLVEQPVLGTPFVARGSGDEGHEAVARAAMHYEYIVGSINNSRVPNGVLDGKRVMQRNQSKELYDSSLRDFSSRGKLSIMALYTALHAPFKPLRLVVKERHGAGSPPQVVLVTLLEVEDESGLRMTGKGEDLKSAEDSRNRAIAELFRQLQLKSAFQATAQTLRSHTHLRVEAASHITDETALVGALRKCVSVHEVVPPCYHQLQQHSQLVQAVRAEGAILHNQELRLLFEAVQHEVGLSALSGPSMFPSAVRQLFVSMGLMSARGSDHELRGGSDGVNLLAVAVSLLAAYIPSPIFPSEARQPLMSGALPLQLAKLLLAGFLMECQHLCIRAAALVLSSVSGTGSAPYGMCGGCDVVEFISPTLSVGAQGFADALISGLRKLVGLLEREVLPSGALRSLLATAPIPNAEAVSRELVGGLTPPQESRLRLAVAFASFPRVFVQKRASPDGGTPRVVVESKGQQRVMNVRVPSHLIASPVSPDQSPGRANVCGRGGGTGDGTSPATGVYCSFPCFCAFDGIPARVDIDCEPPVTLGAFATPPTLLVATACCSDPRILTVADDVPGLAIVDGFVPIVVHGPEPLTTLLRLRDAVKLHWIELKPLPPGLQHAVDNLLCAEHSLDHVVQPGLLE